MDAPRRPTITRRLKAPCPRPRSRCSGVRLVRGRLLGPGDGEGAPLVAVISESLARRYWPDEDPIGQRLRVVGVPQPMSIVGVVADVHQPLAQDSRIESLMYLSYLQTPWPFMTVVVRARADVSRRGPSGPRGSCQIGAGSGDGRGAPAVGRPHGMAGGATSPRHAGRVVRRGRAAAHAGRHPRQRSTGGRVPRSRMRHPPGPWREPGAGHHRADRARGDRHGDGLLCGIAALWVVVPPLQRRIADVPAVDATSLAAMVLLTAAAAGLAAYLPARRARAADIAQTLRAER